MLFETNKTDISLYEFEFSQELIQQGCHHFKKLWYQKNKIDKDFRTLISEKELSDFKVTSFNYF